MHQELTAQCLFPCVAHVGHKQGLGTMPGRDQQRAPASIRILYRRHAHHPLFRLNIWGPAILQDWQDMPRKSCRTFSVGRDSSVLSSARCRSLHDLDAQCKDHKSIQYTLHERCTRVDDALVLAVLQREERNSVVGIHLVVKNRPDNFLFCRV